MTKPDPIAEVFAQNPDHPLVKALREWQDKAILPPHEVDWNDMWDESGRLSDAIDAALPAPTFGEQVLTHLPEGWRLYGSNEERGFWSFTDNGPYVWWAPESADPKAVAEALMLLSGERSEPAGVEGE